MTKTSKILAFIGLSVLVLLVAIGIFNNAGATGQETCPEGDGWVKVDNLDGHTYTYTPEEGYEVTDNCYKHATYVHFGEGATVETDYHCPGVQIGHLCIGKGGWKRHELSHASFKLVQEEPEPTPTPTEEPTPTPDPEVCEDETALNYGKEEECEYPENEEPQEPEVRTPPSPHTDGKSDGKNGAPGVCSINDIGDVANINVVQTGEKAELEVQWSIPTNASSVHIIYGLQKSAEHALLNTPNDGNEVIRHLKSGEHYWFAVAGVRDCGVGNYSDWFDPIVP